MNITTLPTGNALSTPGNAMAGAEHTRKAAEVQAAMAIAKRFPRDQNIAFTNILQACKRKSLAEKAMYSYPRGGQTVMGPSIRLAEVLAQNWGNMDFGLLELDRSEGESSVMAYAWDLETNVKRTTVFQVAHKRDTRQGSRKLTDERDIYELVANMGARRLRACILNVIPGDIVEEAINECNRTMSGRSNEPIKDRLRKMLNAFSSISVDAAMIERYLDHPLDNINEDELNNLRAIFTTIKDGQAKREDYFEMNKLPAPHEELDQIPDEDDEIPMGDEPLLTSAEPPVAKKRGRPKKEKTLREEFLEEFKDQRDQVEQCCIEYGYLQNGQAMEDLSEKHIELIMREKEAFKKQIEL